MTQSDTAGPIWQWSAPAIAASIRNGDISAAESVEAHCARMEAVNPALNAVVIDLRDDARATAAQADADRAAGKPLGPLHGVPVTIKTNVDYRGQANTNGIAAFQDVIAPDDSPVVANLRKAGAIALGLTNTPEFSFRAFTDNPLHGLTKNPWSPLHNPGGSSGGGGAAVAAGVGAIAHGNDIGGSLRFPAWSNGLATIKPTLGRVPAYNPSAPAERPLLAQLMSVQGPMAREVASARLGLQAMAARDWRDPFWCPVPLEGPKPENPVRVLYAQPDDDMDCDPAVMAQVDAAADMLADAGYAVERGPAPRLREIWQLWIDILMAEVQTLQREVIDQVASPALTDTLDAYLAFSNPLDLKGYMTAIAQRSRHVREWMAQLEETPITPASVQPVNLLNEDWKAAGLQIFTAPLHLGAEPARPALRHRPGRHPERPAQRLPHRRHRFREDLARRRPGGGPGRRTKSSPPPASSRRWNLLGLPCAIAPVGTLNGLPNACHIVAGRFREDLALDAAQAIEDRVGVLSRELWPAREEQGQKARHLSIRRAA